MMVVVVDIYCCCQHERSRPWTTLYIQKVDLLGEARAKRKSSGLKIIQHQILPIWSDTGKMKPGDLRLK